jgi:hypothetical protein
LIDAIKEEDPHFSYDQINADLYTEWEEARELAKKSGRWERVKHCAHTIKEDIKNYIEFMKKPFVKELGK